MSKFAFFNDNGLFNTICTDCVSCYDTRSNCFTAVALATCEKSDHLAITPYAEGFRYSTWRYFWSSLSEDENTLANSLEEKHGFFDFMRETGLIEKYDLAYQKAAEEAIDTWMQVNGITNLCYKVA